MIPRKMIGTAGSKIVVPFTHTHTHTHLEGAVLQRLDQAVPSQGQVFGGPLDGGPGGGAPQQRLHVLPGLRQLVQGPPLQLHVLLQALEHKGNDTGLNTQGWVPSTPLAPVLRLEVDRHEDASTETQTANQRCIHG